MSRFFSSFMMDAMRCDGVGSSYPLFGCLFVCCCCFVCLTVVYHVLDTRTIHTIKYVCRRSVWIISISVRSLVNQSFRPKFEFLNEFHRSRKRSIGFTVRMFHCCKVHYVLLITRCYRRRFILDEHKWGTLPVKLGNETLLTSWSSTYNRRKKQTKYNFHKYFCMIS